MYVFLCHKLYEMTTTTRILMEAKRKINDFGYSPRFLFLPWKKTKFLLSVGFFSFRSTDSVLFSISISSSETVQKGFLKYLLVIIVIMCNGNTFLLLIRTVNCFGL